MTNTPEGISTLTSSVIVDDAKATIEAYQKGLGAEVMGTLNCPKSGKIIHACLKIGGASLFVYDAILEMGMTPTGRQQFYLYVDNADNAFEKAKNAGWQTQSDPEDMFWGDRVGKLTDLNGNTWSLAQKVRDVSPEEMQSAVQQMVEAA